MTALPAVYREQATFYTDQYAGYTGVIPAARHQAITKHARKTNSIERFNNTLRQRVSRLWHVVPSALHVFRTIPTFCASMAQKARDTCTGTPAL